MSAEMPSRPEPGDQLMAFLDQLMEQLDMQGLVEVDNVTKRFRLTPAGREKVGKPPRTGVDHRDLATYLRQLGRAVELDFPHVL